MNNYDGIFIGIIIGGILALVICSFLKLICILLVQSIDWFVGYIQDTKYLNKRNRHRTKVGLRKLKYNEIK